VRTPSITGIPAFSRFSTGPAPSRALPPLPGQAHRRAQPPVAAMPPVSPTSDIPIADRSMWEAKPTHRDTRIYGLFVIRFERINIGNGGL
jgi:hypothetical protein